MVGVDRPYTLLLGVLQVALLLRPPSSDPLLVGGVGVLRCSVGWLYCCWSPPPRAPSWRGGGV